MFGIRFCLAWNHNAKTCGCMKNWFKYLISILREGTDMTLYLWKTWAIHINAKIGKTCPTPTILYWSYLDLVKISLLHYVQKWNINLSCFLKTCNVCTTITTVKRFISSQSSLWHQPLKPRGATHIYWCTHAWTKNAWKGGLFCSRRLKAGNAFSGLKMPFFCKKVVVLAKFSKNLQM